MILAWLFHVIKLKDVVVGVLILCGVWSILALLFIANAVLRINFETIRQRKVLKRLALMRWSSEGAHTGAAPLILQLINYIDLHDEPPRVLGICVDPTLLTIVYRSIASVLGGAALSVITNQLHAPDSE